MVPNDLLADLGWRRAGAVCQVDEMGVGGVCEIQMPFALELAIEAVLGAHSKTSTDVSLDRLA
jgi:hypothetical protein